MLWMRAAAGGRTDGLSTRPQDLFAGPFTAAVERVRPALLHAETVPGTPAASTRTHLPRWLGEKLRAAGISSLRPHQAVAVAAGRAGEHFVLSSPTASGKSLCYILPVAATLAAAPEATALYISPAKALAQQQIARMREIVPDLPVALYDGDTPKEKRAEIRGSARVVYTNPDMLHVGILPYHGGWARLFKALRYVVLDEAHMYTGAFGSHAVQILRRLRTIATHYGARPTFVLLSATIGNPGEHAAALVGAPARVIRGTSAGLGPRHLVLVDEEKLSGSAADIFALLLRGGYKTLLFGQSRQGVESLARQVANATAGLKVAAYRSGYRPEERRELESALFQGRLDGMIATNALELGIDVGALDAVVLSAFPGSIAGMWQQIGRAGRTGRPSLAVVVLGDSVLERHYARHPRVLLSESVEKAVVNGDNPFIRTGHARAAAWELSATGRDRTSPAMQVNIRGAGQRYEVMHGGQVLEETDARHALLECYPGAVYLSGRRTFLCQGWEGHKISTREVERMSYYTTPILRVSIHVEGETRGGAGCGRVRVETEVTGLRQINPRTRESLRTKPLQLPPLVMETDGLWLSLPDGVWADRRDLSPSLHAAEHVLAEMMPAVIMADSRDIEGASYTTHSDTGKRPAIFLYDGVQGGCGYCTAAFGTLGDLLKSAVSAVGRCECRDGCPSCIQRSRCRSPEPLSKAGAQRVLHLLAAAYGRSGMRRPAERSD